MTDVSVVVVNHNGGAWIGRCLASVLQQQPPALEVVVVDNASTDGSAADLPAGARLLARPDNDGFGPAAQAGVDATTAPFVCVLNTDVELQPGFLAAAVAVLDAGPDLGSVAPRVLRADDPRRVDATGLGLTSSLGQLNLDSDAPVDTLHEVFGDEPQPVLGPLGGVSLWRRAALQRVGGFPTRWFLYWEDFDLALRLLRADLGCRTAPGAVALHARGGSVGRMSARNVFYMMRNHAPSLLAALPGPVLRRLWPLLIAAPGRALLLYAARGRPFAALAGLIASVLLIPSALRQRREDAGRLDVPDPAAAAARLQTLMAAADERRKGMQARARVDSGASPA